MGRLVYLSPSNQMENKYSYGNTNEGEQMQKVGKVVERLLKQRGLSVYTPAPSVDIVTRGNEANKMHPEVYVAIHSNAGGGKGVEAFYHPANPKSKSIAKSIYDQLSPLTSANPDRGLKDGMIQFSGKGMAEIRTPKAPIAQTLVEVEFHDNANLAKWIIDNTERIGEAIAKGICNYMHIDWGSSQSNTNNNTNNGHEKLYRVQVGAYRDRKNAEKHVNDLKSKGFPAYITYM